MSEAEPRGLPQWAASPVQRREWLQRAACQERQAHRALSRRAHPAGLRHDGRLRGLPDHRGGQMAAYRPAGSPMELELRQAE